MRCLVLAVGRCRDRPILELVERYRSRLPWPLELAEVEGATADPQRRRSEEGRALLARLAREDLLVALDERGEALGSLDFARRLGRWRDEGRRVVFAVGGADGLDPAVIARADLVLALGRLTLPHELARLVLVEQLYRAHCILAGHPYHRA